MDWTKIIWAIAIGGMVLLLWPQAKHMLRNSPKAGQGDWMAVVLPLAAVVGFVILLIMLV